MGIIDQFRKSKEKNPEQHDTPPPRGHTLAEILQDKSNSHLFGELLKREGQEELGTRVAVGKLEQDDIYLLDEYRLKFSEKITQSEKIGKLLTEESVIEIARNHPDFAKIINLLGPKKAIKAIQSQLKEISITDEYRFSGITEPIEEYDSFKNGKYKEKEAEVEKFCGDNMISVKEYLAAIAIEDPREKEKALKELSGRTYSKFKKAVNLLSGGKWAWTKDTTLQGLKENEASMEDSITTLDNLKSDIGDTLFFSVSGNDDMRNALSRELVSESATVAESKTGFGDIKKEAVGAFNEKEFDKDWEAFKKKMAYNQNPDDQDTVRNSFIHQQKKKHRERSAKNKGFWASVFSAIFEEKINSKKNTLK